MAEASLGGGPSPGLICIRAFWKAAKHSRRAKHRPHLAGPKPNHIHHEAHKEHEEKEFSLNDQKPLFVFFVSFAAKEKVEAGHPLPETISG